MGRHPAAVGVGDHRADGARPRLRATRRLRKAVEGWDGFMVEDGDRLRPEACQSPVWDTGARGARAARVRRARRPSAARSGRRVPARPGGHGQGRLGDPHARARARAAGRSSTRTTSTPTPTTPRSSRSRCASSASATTRSRRGLDWLVGMQSRGGGWGAFDVDNQRDVALQDPVLRLRQGHRRAERRRHRARARGARRTKRGYDDAARARPALAARRAGGRRLVVRPLGRQPPLRHRRGAARARGVRRSRRPPGDATRASRWLDSVQQEHGGFGEDIRSYADPAWRGRARLRDAVADGLGAARLRGRRKR